jgi:hypothetical protein
VIMGEVGLGGEVRAIPYLEARLREAEKLGFQQAVIPEPNRPMGALAGQLQIIPVTSVAGAFEGLFWGAISQLKFGYKLSMHWQPICRQDLLLCAGSQEADP